MLPDESVKQICIKLNISQSQLARSLGVTVQTANRWAKGHTTPSENHQQALKALLELCKHDSIDPQELRSRLLGLGAGAAIGLYASSAGLLSAAGLAAGGLLGATPVVGALLAGMLRMGSAELVRQLLSVTNQKTKSGNQEKKDDT